MAEQRNHPSVRITTEELIADQKRAVFRYHLGHGVSAWRESTARKFHIDENGVEVDFSYIAATRADKVVL